MSAGQLPHLETFSKAAELCNFSAAGRALRLTQAAISQRVHCLEKKLGEPLFDRRGGRVMLTESGQKLYDYAQRILNLHAEAWRAISGQALPQHGELALAASSIPGEHMLPGLLADFGTKHPHIHVRAAVSDSMAVIAQVERGEVSLGLVGRKTDDAHLDFRFLAKDRLILVVAPNHPLAKRKRIRVQQLAHQRLVLREVGSGSRHCFEKSLDRAGRSVHDLDIALELGSNEAVKEAVIRGIGIAVLSASAVREELHRGKLRGLEVSDLHCDRDIYCVRDRRRVLPLPARLFLLCLEANFPGPK